jgi:hypothetical protein
MLETLNFYLKKSLDTDEIIENLKESQPEIFEREVGQNELFNFIRLYRKLRRNGAISESLRFYEILESDVFDTINQMEVDRYSQHSIAEELFSEYSKLGDQESFLNFVRVYSEIFEMGIPIKKRPVAIKFNERFEKLGITLPQYAEQLQVRYVQLYKYLNGYNRIPKWIVAKLNEDFGEGTVVII